MKQYQCDRFTQIFTLISMLLFSLPIFSESALMNANNIHFWISLNGQIGLNPHTGTQEGVIYPKNTSNVVYTDGFHWAGYVNDGQQPELRAGGYNYLSGLQPGWIEDDGSAQNPAESRTWRIRPDWKTADLKEDASGILGIYPASPSEEQIQTIRDRYEYDWTHWPWRHGAPFIDSNQNGRMDAGETPGMEGAALTIWLTTNDLNPAKTDSLYGSPPIGLENQITLWSYNPAQYPQLKASQNEDIKKALRNTVFKKMRLVYKGTETALEESRIDSLFFGIWVDSEIGHYYDDLAGCDTLLQLGYGYNSSNLDDKYQEFEIVPPAFGYTLLQGPRNSHKEVLGMTSFWHKGTGGGPMDPDLGIYEGSKQIYNLLNGRSTRGGGPFYNTDFEITRFMRSGDPVSGAGDLDGKVLPPGDRRYMMSTGPFSMQKGQTQEMVYAMTGGSSTDRLAGVTLLKFYVEWIRSFYNDQFSEISSQVMDTQLPPERPILLQAYPNPFNPQTTLFITLHKKSPVTLAVMNVKGQCLKTLIREDLPAGDHFFHWDGKDVTGFSLPSGIYLIRLQTETETVAHKVTLIR